MEFLRREREKMTTSDYKAKIKKTLGQRMVKKLDKIRSRRPKCNIGINVAV